MDLNDESFFRQQFKTFADRLEDILEAIENANKNNQQETPEAHP